LHCNAEGLHACRWEFHPHINTAMSHAATFKHRRRCSHLDPAARCFCSGPWPAFSRGMRGLTRLHTPIQRTWCCSSLVGKLMRTPLAATLSLSTTSAHLALSCRQRLQAHANKSLSLQERGQRQQRHATWPQQLHCNAEGVACLQMGAPFSHQHGNVACSHFQALQRCSHMALAALCIGSSPWPSIAWVMRIDTPTHLQHHGPVSLAPALAT
jgi:hypothetical protein